MTANMSIIKVEISIPEAVKALEEFRSNRKQALQSLTNSLKSAVSDSLNQLLQAEMAIFLGQDEQVGNKRNGTYERTYALKGVGAVRLRMPTDRRRQFHSVVVPPHEQIDPNLKEDLAVLHLAGISTRMLAMMSRRLFGLDVSADTVTKSLATVEKAARQWLTRPLEGKYWALFVDGTNFCVQRRGSSAKEPSLVVLGIDDSFKMSILAIEPGTKDNVECWDAVFSELVRRGLRTQDVRIGVMDGLPGLERLFQQTFSKAVTARCWVHALKNAVAKTPSRLRDVFKKAAQKVMYAGSENEARKAFDNLRELMGKDAERAVRCLEKDLDSLLIHYRFDSSLWRVLRTTNPIERVNREFKRRTKSMDSLGEKTLETLLGFIALRLEAGWQRTPVNAKQIENLRNIKQNKFEDTMNSLEVVR